MAVVLEELTDWSGRLGISYQKRGEGPVPELRRDRAAFFLARCASRFRAVAPRLPEPLDAYNLLVLPRGTAARLVGETAIADLVWLEPSAALVAEVEGLYGVAAEARLAGLAAPVVLPRTNWLNEVMHRYVYERVVARAAGNDATRFLEAELVKEVFYRFDEWGRRDKSRFDLDATAQDGRSALLRRAMAHAEANLFGELSVAELADAAGVSESTLLREFKRGLGRTPSQYVNDRRLEEAMLLLKARRYSVAQVSDMVGYENVSAFGAAFRKKFGVPPSGA